MKIIKFLSIWHTLFLFTGLVFISLTNALPQEHKLVQRYISRYLLDYKGNPKDMRSGKKTHPWYN